MKIIDIEEIKKIFKESFSIADVCRMLNIRPVGGNYKRVHNLINKYSIDISHFIGQGWNKGEKYKYPGKIMSLDDILIKKSTYTNIGLLRIKLIKNGLKENKCENCGIIKWCDKDISLHLHHIDGDNRNHELNNLKVLCPNCHSQTDNFGSKNKINKIESKIKLKTIVTKKTKNNSKVKSNNFCSCGKEIDKRSMKCKKCEGIFRLEKSNENRPQHSQLIKDVEILGYCGTGRKYGVCDNTIRKWIKV